MLVRVVIPEGVLAMVIIKDSALPTLAKLENRATRNQDAVRWRNIANTAMTKEAYAEEAARRRHNWDVALPARWDRFVKKLKEKSK